MTSETLVAYAWLTLLFIYCLPVVPVCLLAVSYCGHMTHVIIDTDRNPESIGFVVSSVHSFGGPISIYNEAAVMTSDPNMPVFYFRSDGREESFTLTIFDIFTPGPPDDSMFDDSLHALYEACFVMYMS